MPERRVRLCVIVTASVSLHALYRGQFKYLQANGFDVTAVSAPGAELAELERDGVRVHTIPIERNPHPLRDLVSLFRMWNFLRREKFDLLHVSTPKAGLIGALAGWLAGYRKILFTLRGRTYENLKGFRRRIFAAFDWIVCRISCCVIPISRGLARAAVEEGICLQEKIRFIGHGSSNGVDVSRFERDDAEQRRTAFRNKLGIDQLATVILFVGRIRVEKGVEELIEASQSLLESHDGLHLLIVGDREDSDPLKPETLDYMTGHNRIKLAGWMPDPEDAFFASDIVAMPSHREGFGNVALESSAAALPIVGFDIPGLSEAIEDGHSGLLVPLGNADALATALETLVLNQELRRELGRQGRERVKTKFSQDQIWAELVELYRSLISNDAADESLRQPRDAETNLPGTGNEEINVESCV